MNAWWCFNGYDYQQKIKNKNTNVFAYVVACSGKHARSKVLRLGGRNIYILGGARFLFL